MAKKPKFYVVWEGRTPGIYTTWDEAQAQVNGHPEALFKAFATMAEAEEALDNGPLDYFANKVAQSNNPATEPQDAAKPTSTKDAATTAVPKSSVSQARPTPPVLPPDALREAIAVDAACSGNPGQMEYRGVCLRTGVQLFHFGPVYGTNNIGEFLAIVHGLALLQQAGNNCAIYSDSRNAMKWVATKQCRTTLPVNTKTQQLHALIQRAENWLRTHTYTNPILKWDTPRWGEIPADFGRKG